MQTGRKGVEVRFFQFCLLGLYIICPWSEKLENKLEV